nr:hypothetical protein [Tanacetum cinerariifolium]
YGIDKRLCFDQSGGCSGFLEVAAMVICLELTMDVVSELVINGDDSLIRGGGGYW